MLPSLVRDVTAEYRRSEENEQREKAAGAATPDASGVVTPERLDMILFEAFVVKGRALLKLIDGLRAMQEQRFFLSLGFPGIVAYAENRFGIQKSEAYDWIRISRALDGLLKVRDGFSNGQIGWSALKQISRVATPETEDEWLEFAQTHTCRQLEAEVRDALQKGRSRPRKDGFSLPNVNVKFGVEFTQDEHVRFTKALDKIACEMSERCGGETISTKDALLHLALLARGTEAAGIPEGRELAERPDTTVVYHLWPQQNGREARAGMSTPDGLVEVPPELVARVAGSSDLEVLEPDEILAPQDPQSLPADDCEVDVTTEPQLDRPNSARLRRKVLLRDGGVCTNPLCDRPARHAHHIQFRSEGGRTELWNETSLCPTCHALVHENLLEVTGSPSFGLRFATASVRPQVDLEKEKKKVEATIIQFESGRPGVRPVADPAAEYEGLEALVRGLTGLGYEKAEARQLLERAIGELVEEGAELIDNRILQQALKPSARPAFEKEYAREQARLARMGKR